MPSISPRPSLSSWPPRPTASHRFPQGTASISCFACCHAFATLSNPYPFPAHFCHRCAGQTTAKKLSSFKTTDLSTFFNRVKTRRLAAGHDLVAGVASIIEIRSGEAGSWPLRGFMRGYEGLGSEYEIGTDKAVLAAVAKSIGSWSLHLNCHFQLSQVRRPWLVTRWPLSRPRGWEYFDLTSCSMLTGQSHESKIVTAEVSLQP